MDILKAELARKRKQLEKADVVAVEKKFFRRGDLAAKQEEEYWTKYYAKHGDKRPVEEAEARAAAEVETATAAAEEDGVRVGRAEAVRRLRERAQPVLLFGESDDDAARRLRKLEIDAPDMKEGYRNDFQDAMSRVDQDYLNEVIQGTHKERGRHDVQVEQELQQFDVIHEMALKELGENDNPARDCEIIFTFFNYLLQKWGHDLNARLESEKRTAKGRYESTFHRQTVEHFKPLITKLHNRNVADDIRLHLVHITKCLARRDYILANNAYMEMAIGNAPWPVGVTRSGIHQRPGSAKSYVANIAHVLNDETQRKYIQSLKRLMTRCQQYFPTDPSRSVEYCDAPLAPAVISAPAQKPCRNDDDVKE